MNVHKGDIGVGINIVRSSLIFLLIMGLPWISLAEEKSLKSEKGESLKPAEKSIKEKTPSVESKTEKKVELTVKALKDNIVGINLANNVPVRGVQFTIKGVKMTEILTTSRTKGFLAKFNQETGKVIILSTTRDEIALGKGLIVKIIGDKDKATPVSLSEVMIVGKNREVL